MAELHVGHEGARVEQGAPDARPEGEHGDEALVVLGRAEGLLGDTRSVGVVDDGEVEAAGRGREDLADVDTDPGLVQVGRGEARAVHHHAREGAPDPAVPVEVLDDAGHDIADRFGRRRLRRDDAQAVGDEDALLDVDDRPLDARAADAAVAVLSGTVPPPHHLPILCRGSPRVPSSSSTPAKAEAARS